MKARHVLMLLGAGVLSACGGGSNDVVQQSTPTGTATFVDTLVAGVEYEYSCDGKTYNGVTDDAGRFPYCVGKEVMFRVGGTVIGTWTPADDGQLRVTPKDFSEFKTDSDWPVKAALVLQNLDKDGLLDNGIQVDISKIRGGSLPDPTTASNVTAFISALESALGVSTLPVAANEVAAQNNLNAGIDPAMPKNLVFDSAFYVELEDRARGYVGANAEPVVFISSNDNSGTGSLTGFYKFSSIKNGAQGDYMQGAPLTVTGTSGSGDIQSARLTYGPGSNDNADMTLLGYSTMVTQWAFKDNGDGQKGLFTLYPAVNFSRVTDSATSLVFVETPEDGSPQRTLSLDTSGSGACQSSDCLLTVAVSGTTETGGCRQGAWNSDLSTAFISGAGTTGAAAQQTLFTCSLGTGSSRSTMYTVYYLTPTSTCKQTLADSLNTGSGSSCTMRFARAIIDSTGKLESVERGDVVVTSN